jgi:epoxide hydrolase
MSIHVQPFRVHVPESDLVELRTRLMRTRWPEAAPLPGWSQGVPLGVW